MSNQIDDSLFDDALNATAPPVTRMYFGQLDVDMYRCVLLKGENGQKGGKFLFDPTEHSADAKRTAIELTITPLASARFHDPIKRELIAESKEWTNIVRPSLAVLNADLRQISGKWVQVESVPSGRKYKDKNTGEEKDSTTFRFVTIFASEADCEVMSDSFFGSRNRSTTASAAAGSSGANGQPEPPHGDTPDVPNPQRATAAKFLPGLWKASGQDVDLFLQKIGGNALTAAHFNIDSPEVVAIVAGG